MSMNLSLSKIKSGYACGTSPSFSLFKLFSEEFDLLYLCFIWNPYLEAVESIPLINDLFFFCARYFFF